jgi:hypothetical protein
VEVTAGGGSLIVEFEDGEGEQGFDGLLEPGLAITMQ